MSSTPQSAQDDLAFMRSLVQSREGVQRPFGESYFAAGVCYGLELILCAAQGLGGIPSNLAWGLGINVTPTVIYVAILAWIVRRGRSAAPTGVVGRAISSVFGSIGLANLALIVVIGSVALRQHSWTTWLIYPCTVFVSQGAAWLVAYSLRRHAWLGVVAAGWFATAVAMACLIQSPTSYILLAGAGLLLFMVVPGAVVVRLTRKSI